MLHLKISLLILIGCLLAGSDPVYAGPVKQYYCRQLVYNHVSPFYPIRGIYEISSETAKSAPHYIFRLDDQGRIQEIINNNTENEKWRNHPLTHLQVYRTVIEYTKNQEIRTYFDVKGNPVVNIRNAFKEIYTYDATGLKRSLDFFDSNGQPVNNIWGIARYVWTKANDMIVEKRYSLDGKSMPISPYFPFFITGIQMDGNGYSAAHYNLNEELKISNNKDGVSVYRDKYDINGNHVEYAYFNESDQPVLTAAKFAKCQKSYDDWGNVIKMTFFDLNDHIVREQVFQYDEHGKLIQ